MLTNCPDCLKYVDGKCTFLHSLQIVNAKCNMYSTDDVSYNQHRYYRSLLLTSITQGMGESNNNFVHEMILKPEWIYRQTGEYYFKVNRFDEIPEKHQKSARFIMVHNRAQSQQSVIGYIPSMSKFTKNETKDFFKFCEIMLDEIGGRIPTEHNQEYKSLRDEILK